MRLIIKCDHLKWCWKPQRFTKWEKLWREFPRYRCAWGAVCCGFLWMAVVWNSCRCGPRTARRAGPLLLFNIDRWCRLKWDYSCSPASRLNAHLISRKARVCVCSCVDVWTCWRQLGSRLPWQIPGFPSGGLAGGLCCFMLMLTSAVVILWRTGQSVSAALKLCHAEIASKFHK